MPPLRQGGFLISKIHQLSGRIFHRKLKAYNLDKLNPAQGRILFVLWQHDGITIQELARRTGLGQSTLTSMLDRLEAAGHLVRTADPDDRRKTLIRVTPQEQTMKAVYDRVSSEMIDLFYRGFTETEIENFERLLLRILANLNE